MSSTANAPVGIVPRRNAEKVPTVPTLVEYTRQRLRALCDAADLSDDGTLVEFSVAIADGQAEVRAPFEPQGERPTLNSYRVAALALNERLEREFGANLHRFRQVRYLFLPEDMRRP